MLRVSKNAAARLVAQVLAKLLSLVLVALVARYESAAGLGRYVLILTIVGFAGAITDLGLNVYLTREVARAGSGARQADLLGRVLSLKAGLSILGVALLVAASALAPGPGIAGGLLPLGALLLVPEAAMGALRSYVNGRQRMEVSAAVDVSARLIAAGASVPLLIAGYGVAGVLAASLAAAVAGVLAYRIVVWRWAIPIRLGWTPAAWRADLSESYPFALTSVSAMVYSRADLLLLGFWAGETAAGLYSAAYKLWEAAGLLPASLLDAMFPELSRLAASEGGQRRLRDVFGRVALGLLAGGMLLALALALAAGTVFGLVYGADAGVEPAILPFRLLVWGIPAMFVYLFGGHLLYALGRQRSVMVTMLAAGGLNVALNLIVIPRWSYLGASAVALASEWLLALALITQARSALLAFRPGPVESPPS